LRGHRYNNARYWRDQIPLGVRTEHLSADGKSPNGEVIKHKGFNLNG
jgi:hypothetical protein